MAKKITADTMGSAKGKKKTSAVEMQVVVIGASAGGLDAVRELLENIKDIKNMTFFYLQHLSPDHPSSLTAILAQKTSLKVQDAANNMPILAGNLYVCTPNKEMIPEGGKITVIPRDDSHLPYLPIDDFFSVVAREYTVNAIGVVLSGNAGDGTRGLKAIKENGGITFAQDETAKYSSMPASAISAGVVDFVLPPRAIADELLKISKAGYQRPDTAVRNEEDEIRDDDADLKAILHILHQHTRVDFSHYKMNTIKRRMLNRMLKCSVKNLKEYHLLLSQNSDELEILYKDLLINVTSFFRDADAFDCLKDTYLPQLLKNKKQGEVLRIWVTACSTGEEAYSIAMMVLELQAQIADKIPVQVFATDLSESAINVARAGLYTEGDVKAIPAPLVKKYFTREGNSYRVVKQLREMCLFATHNLLSDPPFSRMDLITCCNLLIYFDAAAQKRAIPTLHFALNDGGYLMLGKSETIGSSALLFNQIDSKFKIYSRKKDTGIRKVPELVPRFPGNSNYNDLIVKKHTQSHQFAKNKNVNTSNASLSAAIDGLLLANHMPACAVINEDMEILQFRGSTSLYLTHQQGKASLNILKMARPEYVFELRSAISKAIKLKQAVTAQDIEMQLNNVTHAVSLSVYPIVIEFDEPLLLIVFTASEKVTGPAGENAKISPSKVKDNKIKKLTEELNALRAEMQGIIEAQETTYEDLQAANEEIVSSNEEFQTLNEELETSKEEIEASNEELITTNQELRVRNEMLGEANSYSEAILDTIHEPMLILGNTLQIKSANKSFYKTFHFKKEETEGLSLFDQGNRQWDIPELHTLLKTILARSTSFNNFKVKLSFPKIGEKVMLLNANRIEQKTVGEQLILLAIQDITLLASHQDQEREQLHNDIKEGKKLNELHEKAVLQAVLLRTEEIGQAKKILEDKNDELEVANKDLMSFTYVSSHDLQEPLRKIQIFSSIILKEEEQNLSANGKMYFGKMQETARRMQILLEDLLAYSRTKNVNLDFEHTNLSALIGKVVADFEEMTERTKATITFSNLGEALVIPFQFSILVTNLISNSFKFAASSRPLEIKITGKVVQGNTLKIPCLNDDTTYYRLSFKDNGIGFDNQYRDRIFEVFQRLHNRMEYEGSGIGLAICKRIAENNHGAITASGTLHHGARFDVYIPA